MWCLLIPFCVWSASIDTFMRVLMNCWWNYAVNDFSKVVNVALCYQSSKMDRRKTNHINDEANSLSERVKLMFNLPWPSRKHRSVSIGRTVFTWGRNVRHPRSHVFADIHTIRLGIFWSTCILVISNSGLVLWFTRKHQFNSNYRSAWSLLKISPENSFSF